MIWRILFIVAAVVLIPAVVVIGLGYSNTSNKLQETNITLAGAQAQIVSLQDNLSATQQSLASTTADRDSYAKQLTSVQSNLAACQSNLSAANQSLATMTADRDSYKNQLMNSQALITTLQANITTLQNQLSSSKLRYFDSEYALTTWLSSEPTFNSGNLFSDSIQLQNVALRNGYLLFAYLYKDTDGILYSDCEAFCNDGYMYLIDPNNHQVFVLPYEGVQPAP